MRKNYFENEEYEEFAGFFQEEKYLIPLWAAHMLLEYGKPSDELIISSLEVIENYFDNPLAPEISNEERSGWMIIKIFMKINFEFQSSFLLKSGCHGLTSDRVTTDNEIRSMLIP